MHPFKEQSRVYTSETALMQNSHASSNNIFGYLTFTNYSQVEITESVNIAEHDPAIYRPVHFYT
jgi:hypothetical protein